MIEIDTHKRLHGPWHYDEVIDGYLKECVMLTKTQKHVMSVQQAISRASTKMQNPSGLVELTAKRETSATKIKELQLMGGVVAAELTRCRTAHPFLIGPATLDALLERKSEKWEYVENGHLPFNDMFFDLQEPWKVRLPFGGRETEIVGVSLHKSGAAMQKSIDVENNINNVLASPHYLGILHYRSPKDCELPFGRINLAFERKVDETFPEPYLDIKGSCEGSEDELEKATVRFRAIPHADLLFFRTEDGINEYRRFGKVEIAGEGYFQHTTRLSEVDASSVLSKTPNLLVNLVNYINSHNVRVVSRSRKPRILHVGSKFIEEPSSRKPFHVIVVSSGEVVEDRESSKSYELNVREAVRGHDRHYRNPDGGIRLVKWIEPYIRGPDDAPWRETRYDVNHKELGEKILREREMRRDLGIE